MTPSQILSADSCDELRQTTDFTNLFSPKDEKILDNQLCLAEPFIIF